LLAGEHFLSHEDAFPVNTALEKGYQRRATLLVYLNDVAECVRLPRMHV
jgi:prolyl 4-hydroxylase